MHLLGWPYKLSATDLAQAIRTRRVRAVDAVSACFERIDQDNDRLKAFITICREQAEAEAIKADAAVERGEHLGSLHGVPFAIKDLTATAGIRTTYGSVIYKDYVPSKDELCVARLRAAGGILIGKTNTPEFGLGNATTNELYGPTANPYDLDKSCGGSSGGSAVAVSAQMCPLAQGSDFGGSVRTPASFCGIVGLRPSVGRIPQVPKNPLWESLAVDGVLARDVKDAALMLSVMAGQDRRDPVSIAQPSWSMPDFSDEGRNQIRVGFSHDLGIAIIDTEVAEVFHQAIERMAPVCQSVSPDCPDCSGAQETFETLRAALLLHQQRHHYEKYGALLSENVRWNVERGFDIKAADYLRAETERDRIYLNFLEFFERYDILATVSASVPPFPRDQQEILDINGVALRNIIDYLTITYTISLTGLPALSIPCGWTKSGLPIGMQLVGKPQGEAELLRFAFLLQEKLNFRHRWHN